MAPLDLTRAYCKVCHSKAAYDHNGCAAPCNTCGALHQYYLPEPVDAGPHCGNCGEPSEPTVGGSIPLACHRCGSGNVRLAGPKLPGWNMTERAARAEMLAERLAFLGRLIVDGGTPAEWAGFRAALDAWAEHRRQLAEQGAA